jgi:hypothetical protein
MCTAPFTTRSTVPVASGWPLPSTKLTVSPWAKSSVGTSRTATSCASGNVEVTIPMRALGSARISSVRSCWLALIDGCVGRAAGLRLAQPCCNSSPAATTVAAPAVRIDPMARLLNR